MNLLIVETCLVQKYNIYLCLKKKCRFLFLMQCIYFESRAEIDFRSPVKNNFIGFDSDIRIGYGHVSLRLLVSDMVSNLYIFRMVFPVGCNNVFILDIYILMPYIRHPSLVRTLYGGIKVHPSMIPYRK